MFLGREKELKEFNRLYNQDTFQMLVLYGRRRVGKTTLLKEFCKEKPTIFFSAENSNEKLNLDKFSEQVFLFFNIKTMENFTQWSKAFGFITEKAMEKQVILIIDEFPYLAENNKVILSILQHTIDNSMKDSKLFLVLCGSYMGFMEREVLGVKSPIFGRRTAQLHMKSFDYYDSADFVKEYSNEDKMMVYGIFGGTPHYLNHLDAHSSLEDNMKYNYFVPIGYLYEETSLLLQQELREPGVYNAIIEAIAGGATRLNEISVKTGEDNAKCAKYIATLIELGIVIKQIPLGEKETSRKSIYKLADNMFLFWYRFVAPNKTLIETDSGDIVIQKRVNPYLRDYMGIVFEDACKEYLLRMNRKGELPFLFDQIGRWWGTDNKKKEQVEIDIVANDKSDYLFCECKWREDKVNINVVKDLIEKSKLFHCVKKYFIIFSKTGFTNAVIQYATENKDIILYSLEDMYKENL